VRIDKRPGAAERRASITDNNTIPEVRSTQVRQTASDRRRCGRLRPIDAGAADCVYRFAPLRLSTRALRFWTRALRLWRPIDAGATDCVRSMQVRQTASDRRRCGMVWHTVTRGAHFWWQAQHFRHVRFFLRGRRSTLATSVSNAAKPNYPHKACVGSLVLLRSGQTSPKCCACHTQINPHV
jgi:hypothetical protein